MTKGIKNSDEFLKAMKGLDSKKDSKPDWILSLEEYLKKTQDSDVASKKHGGSIKIR